MFFVGKLSSLREKDKTSTIEPAPMAAPIGIEPNDKYQVPTLREGLLWTHPSPR